MADPALPASAGKGCCRSFLERGWYWKSAGMPWLCVCVLGERGESGRVVLKLLIRSREEEWSLVFHMRNAKRTRLVWGCEMERSGNWRVSAFAQSKTRGDISRYYYLPETMFTTLSLLKNLFSLNPQDGLVNLKSPPPTITQHHLPPCLQSPREV